MFAAIPPAPGVPCDQFQVIAVIASDRGYAITFADAGRREKLIDQLAREAPERVINLLVPPRAAPPSLGDLWPNAHGDLNLAEQYAWIMRLLQAWA